jgi:hypothetical protein
MGLPRVNMLPTPRPKYDSPVLQFFHLNCIFPAARHWLQWRNGKSNRPLKRATHHQFQEELNYWRKTHHKMVKANKLLQVVGAITVELECFFEFMGHGSYPLKHGCPQGLFQSHRPCILNTRFHDIQWEFNIFGTIEGGCSIWMGDEILMDYPLDWDVRLCLSKIRNNWWCSLRSDWAPNAEMVAPVRTPQKMPKSCAWSPGQYAVHLFLVTPVTPIFLRDLWSTLAQKQPKNGQRFQWSSSVETDSSS